MVNSLKDFELIVVAIKNVPNIPNQVIGLQPFLLNTTMRNRFYLYLFMVLIFELKCDKITSAYNPLLPNVMRITTVGDKMFKFCANLAFLFPEKPLLERYKLAKEAGFKAVETGFPIGLAIEQVVNAKKSADIQQILINIFTGDVTKGELGFAAIPGKEDEFKRSIETTIKYAKALEVKKIHIMAGKVEGEVTEAHDTAYENNLRYAVSLLEKENILGLIEPINKYSVPHYYMNCYKKALAIINKISSPNLKLMLDVFHLQLIQGDISNTIKELINKIGHVQIAQAPNRNEPNSPGEINFQYVLGYLQKVGYNDWIGLEYKPLGDTKDGLKWIEDFGYTL